MAIAFTAWLIAPAPMAWTQTLCWLRMTPAMAPATATGLEVAETLRTSTGRASPYRRRCKNVCGRRAPRRSELDSGRSVLGRVGAVHGSGRRTSTGYLAYSTLLVSLRTVTRTCPG